MRDLDEWISNQELKRGMGSSFQPREEAEEGGNDRSVLAVGDLGDGSGQGGLVLQHVCQYLA